MYARVRVSVGEALARPSRRVRHHLRRDGAIAALRTRPLSNRRHREHRRAVTPVTRASDKRPTVRTARGGENSVAPTTSTTRWSSIVDAVRPWRDKMELVLFFAGWYYFSIAFNVHQKTLLKAFPMPLTVTACELILGATLAVVSRATSGRRGLEMPGRSALGAVTMLATTHLLGNAFTNVSLGKVAVSFTHTVKALEPVFSVGLSALFLGTVPSLAVCASLVPIVVGVVVASATEVSFCAAGFASAMGSNLTFQSRNVLSKFIMQSEELKKLDYVGLLGVVTVVSAALAVPLALVFEGSRAPAAFAALAAEGGVDAVVLAGKTLFYASVCFQLYQQLSYSVLERVSPVTHSVGNSLKRVVVIAASVVIFRNPVSATNIAGTALAIAGVVWYGRVKKK
jgi:solute carrier family 35 protein E1